MNNRAYFFAAIFFLAGFSKNLRAEVEASTKQPIVINNVNSSVPPHVSITINNAINIDAWITNKTQKIIAAARNKGQKLMSLKEFSIAYCAEHKGFLFFGSLISVYAVLLARLLYLEYFLSNSSHWSLWKHETPRNQLCLYPQKELAKELLFAIQQRYHTSTTLTDFFTPLICFFNFIEQEKKLLQQFITMHRLLDKVWLRRIFPTQHELCKTAQKRLKRLDFLKQLLINWLAEYKVAANAANIVDQIK